MGFYGQITNSNKASFTFDKTYANRAAMESECQSDGVFLGRYVLIEYDDPAIGVYYDYKSENGEIYASQTLNKESKITAVLNRLYQDIVTGIFYVGLANGKVKAADINADKTPYAYNYNIDVTKYGRGYDSTAWVKRYDTVNNTYKYTMIAELNTVVPELHVLIDPPQEKAHAPYWDHESTNLDYYLHLAGNYHDTIKRAASKEVSDETVNRLNPQWTYDPIKGIEDYKSTTEAINADIFYNKAGFNPDVHKYVTMDDAINFAETSGGRRYATDVFHPHAKVDQLDTREWYIRLPSIGNAICQVWDKMYGEDRNKTAATEREDPKALYDDGTVIGFVNRVRDVLGHTFHKLETNTPSETYKEDINLYYVTQIGSDIPHEYYYYAYSPDFKLNTSGDYYYDSEDKAYKLANKIVTPAENLYEPVDRWELTKLNIPTDDTLYGLIFNLHKLLGTGDVDTRSLDTIHGCINRIKDIIDNIDTQLVPNRLLWTTSNGVIQTSNTQFPSAAGDSTKVLTGAGTWESRFKNVQVNATSTVENADAAQTATLVSDDTAHNNTLTINVGNKWIRLAGDAEADSFAISHMLSALSASTIESDAADALKTVQTDNELIIPWIKTDNAGHVIATGTYSYYVPHTFKTIEIAKDDEGTAELSSQAGSSVADTITDTYTMGTANKWLRMANVTDSMKIGHTLSPVITDAQLSKTDGLASNISYTIGKQDQTTDDEATYTFNVPYYTVDRAGHITASSTQTVTLAHGTSGVTAGSYGLASDETVATLDTDNTFEVPYYTVNETGHITSTTTNTVTLPENFTVIKTTSLSTSTDEQAEAKADITASTLVDTLTFAAGNKWIRLASNANSKSIAFAHALSPIKAVTDGGDTTNQTPKFGDSFEVPNFSTDNAGHITSVSTHTVTIPQNDYSETKDKTAGVITTIALTKDSGKFDATRVNVGTLALAEYSYDATNANKVVNTDSINTAFSKVDAQIAKEITDRTTAITDVNTALAKEIADRTTAIADVNTSLATKESALEKKIKDEQTAREAADKTLQDNLTIESGNRQDGDTSTLNAANKYTDDKIAGLVNGAPATLDTLKEIADMLGNNEGLENNLVTLIGNNETHIAEAQEDIDNHIADKNNPHGVNKNQLGLDQVTNESKTTMFTNPVFTGIAKLGTENLATEAYVVTAITTNTTAWQGAITEETGKWNKTLADEQTSRDAAIALAVQNAFADLMLNYNLALNAPEFEVATVENETSITITVTITNYTNDDHSMIWYKKQLDADPIVVSETVPVGAFEITEDGSYYCVITRTHNGHTSEAKREFNDIIVPRLPEPEPEPTPDPEPDTPVEEPDPTPDPEPETPTEEPEV